MDVFDQLSKWFAGAVQVIMSKTLWKLKAKDTATNSKRHRKKYDCSIHQRSMYNIHKKVPFDLCA